jgi:hypothetical protein
MTLVKVCSPENTEKPRKTSKKPTTNISLRLVPEMDLGSALGECIRIRVNFSPNKTTPLSRSQVWNLPRDVSLVKQKPCSAQKSLVEIGLKI